MEVFAGGVVLWRLAKESQGETISAAAELRAVKLIAGTFFLLAAGIGVESVRRLGRPHHNPTRACSGSSLPPYH